MPDLKWQALAKGKLLFIPYLNLPKFCIEKKLIYIFSTTYLNFPICFLHAGIFLALFPFFAKSQKYFSSIKFL